VAVVAALWLSAAIATACNDSGPSFSSQGDNVIDDTRDSSTRAPANPEDGAAPTGQPDGAYANGQPEASYDEGSVYYGDDAPASTFPGVSECSACACPSATSYCFGGATARKDPMILSPQAKDAGAPCPKVSAGQLGCTALPSGATTCAEIINELQPAYSCYLVCAFNGTTMSVYCPSP
jgi:hypothetical protein